MIVEKRSKLYYDKITADLDIDHESLNLILIDLINRSMIKPQIYINCKKCDSTLDIVEKTSEDSVYFCEMCNKNVKQKEAKSLITLNIDNKKLEEIPFFRTRRADNFREKQTICS